jgi:GNAT superfamily N-acetyltransferase
MAREIRGLRESELEAHSELVHQSYYEYVVSGERNFLGDPHWWLKAVQSDPYYDPDQTRTLFVNGQMVASVTNYLRWLYLPGGRRAKVSAIGSVCTHPDHRRQGHVKRVLGESLEWMQREGFHWSFLFGKEEVYGGSGWTILSSLHLTADLRLRPAVGEGLSVRQADPATDVAVLSQLYDEFASRQCGLFVRGEQYWQQRVLRPRLDGEQPLFTLLYDGDQAVGYYQAQGSLITELAWATDRGAAVVAHLLRQHEGAEVQFACCTSELIRALRHVSEIPSHSCYFDHAGGMTLTEAYKGLWRYVGDPANDFPTITDTDSLKVYLRDHEYMFWRNDSF